MSIIANVCISLSEVQKVHPEFDEHNITDPTVFEALKEIMYSVGMDTKFEIMKQRVQHRNRFNEVVNCTRFMGQERTDKEWLVSGLASDEASNIASGSLLVADLHRFKNQY